MSKIEISMDEYKFLKEENKKVYEENVRLTKENEALHQELNNVVEVIEDVKESGLFERMFDWGSIVSMLESFLTKITNKWNM